MSINSYQCRNGLPLTTEVASIRPVSFVNRAEEPSYVLEKNMPLDTEYYVEKQILPPVLRIFESFGVTKDRLCSRRGQSSLFSFTEAPKEQKQKSLFDF